MKRNEDFPRKTSRRLAADVKCSFDEHADFFPQKVS